MAQLSAEVFVLEVDYLIPDIPRDFSFDVDLDILLVDVHLELFIPFLFASCLDGFAVVTFSDPYIFGQPFSNELVAVLINSLFRHVLDEV